MAEPGSITRWLKQLQAGERAAAQQLWEAYVRKLIELAHKKLEGPFAQAADSYGAFGDPAALTLTVS